MGHNATSQNPLDEYTALLRVVSARLELEQGFGIDRWKLPAPVASTVGAAPAPAAAARGGTESPGYRALMAARGMGKEPPAPTSTPRTRPAQPRTQPPRPASPTPVSAAEPPTRVVTHSSIGLFEAKDYNVDIPEGLSKKEQLDVFAEQLADCTLCPLHQGRNKVVFGAGNPDADLMFIGEAPGRDEDAQGIPFIGRAGQLLTKIIEAMGFTRDEVYITNINKCRPPNNRAPMPDEMAKCEPFLLRQIKIIEPKVICLLGATAVRGLLQVKQGITKLRGTFMEWNGVLVMPTYHPAYLLRNPHAKRDVWEDVQKVRDKVREG